MLVRMGHIKPVQLPPLTLPFPRWYNAHVRYDYHAGNPGHPTKNCIALKRKVRDLIKDGKLKVEDLGRPVEVEDSSRIKAEMPKLEEKTPKEANFGKTTMPKEKVPITKAVSSSTTEGSKERSCEPNVEEEKIVLQELVRNLERILNEQNEYITTLRGEHNGQSLKRRWTSGNGDA